MAFRVKQTAKPARGGSPGPEAVVAPTAAPVAEPLARPEPVHAPVARKETKSRAGKPVQFWIHEEDRRLLRELSAWLAGQGERPTDSMVIRSALRVTKTGGDLLKAYRQASQLDGRLKQRKSA